MSVNCESFEHAYIHSCDRGIASVTVVDSDFRLSPQIASKVAVFEVRIHEPSLTHIHRFEVYAEAYSIPLRSGASVLLLFRLPALQIRKLDRQQKHIHYDERGDSRYERDAQATPVRVNNCDFVS